MEGFLFQLCDEMATEIHVLDAFVLASLVKMEHIADQIVAFYSWYRDILGLQTLLN